MMLETALLGLASFIRPLKVVTVQEDWCIILYNYVTQHQVIHKVS